MQAVSISLKKFVKTGTIFGTVLLSANKNTRNEETATGVVALLRMNRRHSLYAVDECIVMALDVSCR